jgi:CRP-like cAMP-binding protein
MPSATTSESLRKLPFFAGLPETLLWHLARAAERRTLATNECLFQPGEPRTVLAIILEGELSIEQVQDGATVQITSLGAGEVIGEGILLDDSRHGSAGRATEPTALMCFRKDPLMKLLKDQPALYAALLGRAAKIISDRIKRANAALVGVTSEFAGVRVQVEQCLKEIAALGPVIGYEQAVAVAREAVAAGRDVRQFAIEKKLINT